MTGVVVLDGETGRVIGGWWIWACAGVTVRLQPFYTLRETWLFTNHSLQ